MDERQTSACGWIRRAFAALGGALASLRGALRSRYVRMLEDEVERLRAENRALLNSLLGTAGVPPLTQGAEPPVRIPPMRRRSWPQMQIHLEAEAARQERQERINAAKARTAGANESVEN